MIKDTIYKVKSRRAAVKSKTVSKDSCQVSNKEAQSDGQASTSKKPTYEVFRCHSCKLFFLTKENVLAHFNKRHGPSTKPVPTYRYVTRQKPQQAKYKCQECLTWFIDSKALDKHSRKHHKESSLANKGKLKKSECLISLPDAKSLEEGEKTLDDQGNQIYQCNLCDANFSSQWSWKFHLSFHSDSSNQKFVCKVCEKSFDCKKSYDEHAQMCAQEMFECDCCSKRFASKQHLKQHVQSHMDSKESSEQLKASFLERLSLVRQALSNAWFPFWAKD